MLCFAVSVSEVKWLLKTVAILQGLVIIFSPWESALGKVAMSFHVFFELVRLDSNYFL